MLFDHKYVHTYCENRWWYPSHIWGARDLHCALICVWKWCCSQSCPNGGIWQQNVIELNSLFGFILNCPMSQSGLFPFYQFFGKLYLYFSLSLSSLLFCPVFWLIYSSSWDGLSEMAWMVGGSIGYIYVHVFSIDTVISLMGPPQNKLTTTTKEMVNFLIMHRLWTGENCNNV